MAIDLEKYRKATTTPATSTKPVDLSKYKKASPTSFEPERKTGLSGFLGKARDVATSVIGGGKLAIGAGLGLAAPKVQSSLSNAEQKGSDIELSLVKRINEKRKKGEDASELQKQLGLIKGNLSSARTTQENFVGALPSTKEVVGSSLRLGGTLAGGAIASKAGNLFGVGKASTVGAGILRGAGAGAATGAIEGGIQGAGMGIEKEKGALGVLGSAAIGAGVGIATGGVLGGLTGGISTKLRQHKAFNEELGRVIRENPDATTAKYKLSGEGKIVSDPVAKEAIKQGMDDGVVATVKGSSPADKAKMSAMVDILEKGKRDPRFAATNRPSDVIGDSVLERFKIVNTTNKNAAKQLDTVAKTLAGKKADPTPAVQAFIDDLDSLGIRFNNGKAVYQGSQIEGLTEPQAIIDRIVKRMNEVSDDAYELHNLKKFIDEQVTYGKTTAGLSGKTVNALKGLRHNLDGILDSSFPEYNSVNTTFSTTRDVLDDLMTAAGTRFDPTDANANARLGTLARRILSNAQSRTEVLNAIQKLQTVAEANGGKFSDDVISQIVFVNDLERLFGTSAPTSLAGEVSKGIKEASGIVGKMKSADGLGSLGLQIGAETIENARNITPEGLTTSIRALLK